MARPADRGDADGRGIAELVEFLISAGHPPEAVWRYSPRQAAAFAELAVARLRREKSFDLTIARAAFHGKDDPVRRFQKKLDGD